MSDKQSIKSLYAGCQTMIAAINSAVKNDQEVPNDMLESLRENFNKFIDFEKIFLIHVNDVFYGMVLSELDTAIDFNIKGPIDLKIDFKNHGTSKFKMLFNPLYCEGYQVREFTGLLVSEILKLAYDHPATFASLNHEKDPKKHKNLEDAGSASVSSMIMKDMRNFDNTGKGLSLPKNAYTSNNVNLDTNVRAREDGSIDYYFHLLEKFKKDPPEEGGGSGAGGISKQNQSGGGGESGKNPFASPNNNNGNQTHDWEGGDSEELNTSVKDLVSRVFNSMSDHARGLMPAGLVSQIKKLLAPPEINWKQYLRKLVGNIRVPNRPTSLRLNRRQPERMDLHGKLPKRIVNIVVVIDSSGSVSDDDVQFIIAEILNIVKGRKAEITIIECDAQINAVYTVKTINDVVDKIRGRGGTMFTPAIEFINGNSQDANWAKHPKHGKFRDALMVYFTDGYGESEIPKPRTYRNLWVVLNDVKALSVKNPYGEVKRISTDKEWRKRKGLN